jgi:hypothetical protein
MSIRVKVKIKGGGSISVDDVVFKAVVVLPSLYSGG